MCDAIGDSVGAAASAPREAPGSAVDPIRLDPVDEVVVTTLVDNFFDALLTGDERHRRATFGVGRVERTTVRVRSHRRGAAGRARLRRAGDRTPRQQHHDAPVRHRDSRRTPWWSTPTVSGCDLDEAQAIVLSHGHFDHTGGLAGLAGKEGVRSLPMVVHPQVWTRRRLAVPGREPEELPTLSKRALGREGFEVIERRQPSLLLDGSVLITGEVDRTTDFERGMPPSHQAWTGATWEHDPTVIDDQALVVHVRGRGLVVLTGCGHAGAVNIVRHAMRLTGVPDLHALLGGLHLGGPAFEPIIGPTVEALATMAPDLVVPGHCTGWRAQHALAAALPDAWVTSSVGSSYRLTAA